MTAVPLVALLGARALVGKVTGSGQAGAKGWGGEGGGREGGRSQGLKGRWGQG